jgi:hypothetical protein
MPPRKSSTSDFNEMRNVGIALASKVVIEDKFEMVKMSFYTSQTWKPTPTPYPLISL